MSTPLSIKIDRSSPIPLYHQVAQGIEGAIRDGSLASGTRLENEIELAQRLRLSRPTIRKAMDDLVQSGLLVRKRGVGTQVVSSQIRRHLELSSLNDDLERAGKKPSTTLLSFEHIPATEEIQELLSLPKDVSVYHFTRLRSAGGSPLALMENWVRDDIVELDEKSLRTHGLYELLREAGINFRLAQQRIGATIADDAQAKSLETSAGSALVTMQRTAVDDTGRNVETGSHVYRADAYSFEMTLVQR